MPDVTAAASAARASTVPFALARKMNAGSIKTDSKTDRFIIKYKDGTTERSAANAVQLRLDKFASALPARAHRKRRMGVGADVVTTERKLNAEETKAFMRAIASDPNVEYVEPDSDMQALMAPNDPDYRMQYYLRSNLPPGVAGIRAEGAWDITQGQGSVIAVVDDGFTSHSDLNANILPGLDIGSRDGRGWNPGSDGSCEVSFHGTHVAGIAAAVANNGVGIAGVAPGAKVESARALGPCGSGPLSDVVDGIVWAAGGTLEGVPANANPAKVINLSLGNWTPCSVTMQSAIDFATSKGAVVVAAAGNRSKDVSSMQPANCHNVIAVGGTDGYGNSYIDSNFGPGIDIAAPAKEIWSLYNDGTTVPTSEAYRYMSGTSMATPMVSGVIALAQATRQTPLTVAEYRSLLRQSVQPFPSAPDRNLGPGILDATKTVTAARTGVIPVAADFACHSEDSEDMWVHCEDLSTARGGAPIQTRTWDFGSSTSRTDFQDPLHFRYKYAGTYPVTLTVKDSNGQTSSYTRSVEVSAPATVDLPANTQTPFSGAYGNGVYFRTTVPPGTKSLTYALQNTSDKYGAAAIYVNDAPSEMLPACSKTIQGDTFSCTVDSPKAGLWYAHYWVTSNSLSGATASVTVK
ncbi:S8 family serine peptidase [Paraburkholderia caledonica]|uniref:S8 family serine peptidase n=1 Tax=Paraburkholderia caledonica TaxID=134536 RepID=UPI0018783FCA